MKDSEQDDDVYLRLREYLHSLPTGFPATDSGVEVSILEKIFTPEEAEMTMQLRLVAEPPEEIAERCGMTVGEASRMLEHMAEKGLIYPMRGKGETLYMALSWMPGLLETQLDKIDGEMAGLLYDYNADYFSEWLERDTQVFRVIPVDTAIEAAPMVETYDRIRDLVKDQEHLSVMPCLCRKAAGELGNDCERPHETCFVFGPFSRHFVESGDARYVTADEALDILDACEESALVLQPVNARELNGMCCCCSCCCMMLRELKALPRPAEVVQSSFSASIDPGACNACGSCLERCQMDAIDEGDPAFSIDIGRCIGCGLCASHCPESAISLVPRSDALPVPANIFETLARIAGERGQPFGRLRGPLRYTTSPLFIKGWTLLNRLGLAKPVVKILDKRGLL